MEADNIQTKLCLDFNDIFNTHFQIDVKILKVIQWLLIDFTVIFLNIASSSTSQSAGAERSGGTAEQSVNQTIGVSGQQPTTLLFDKSTLFSSGGNVIFVTMDQQEQAW